MRLIDEFAKAALSALMADEKEKIKALQKWANSRGSDKIIQPEAYMAKQAYDYAQAMLKESENRDDFGLKIKK